MSLTGAISGGGTAVFAGNSYHSGLTLSGSWGDLKVGPDIFVGGSLTNSATGNVLVNESGVISTNGKMLAFGSSPGSDQPVVVTGGLSGTTSASIGPNGGGIGFVVQAPNTISLRSNGNNELSVNGYAVANDVALADQSYTYNLVTTGFSYQIPSTTTSVVLDEAGTLATGTIILPNSITDGQTVRVGTSNTISALAVTPYSGTANKCTASTVTLTQATPLHCIYRLANVTWYPN